MRTSGTLTSYCSTGKSGSYVNLNVSQNENIWHPDVVLLNNVSVSHVVTSNVRQCMLLREIMYLPIENIWHPDVVLLNT